MAYQNTVIRDQTKPGELLVNIKRRIGEELFVRVTAGHAATEEILTTSKISIVVKKGYGEQRLYPVFHNGMSKEYVGRKILGLEIGDQRCIRYRDGDTLNNTVENLEVYTATLARRRPHLPPSIKPVLYKVTGGWQVSYWLPEIVRSSSRKRRTIIVNGKTYYHYTSQFKTIEEAEMAQKCLRI